MPMIIRIPPPYWKSGSIRGVFLSGIAVIQAELKYVTQKLHFFLVEKNHVFPKNAKFSQNKSEKNVHFWGRRISN